MKWENAGRATDWTVYTFEHQALFVVWRDAEQEIKRIHDIRIQGYIKAKFSTPNSDG